MATTEAERRAMRKYYMKNKGRTRGLHMRLDIYKDADILAALDAQASKSEYVKRLIRQDLEGER